MPTIIGTSGDDLIHAGLGDSVEGGEGIDTLVLDLRAATSGVVAHFVPFSNPKPVFLFGATISGVEIFGPVYLPDYFNIFSVFDPLNNRGATIYGGAAADSISGANGNDMLFGGSGADHLHGYEADDYLDGGDGNDHIKPGRGHDIAAGGAGFDLLLFIDLSDGVTIDLALNHAGNGSTIDTSFSGIEGVYGSNGNDSIFGDAAGNQLVGADGDDLVDGRDGFDSISGGNGNDQLLGGDGDDFIGGDAGSDTIDGGNGFDTVDYSSSAGPVTVDLSSGVGDGGDAAGDTYSAIEAVTGSVYDDTLLGNEAENMFIGNGGSDTMEGYGGDDLFVIRAAYLEGQTEQRTLDGGAGIDTVGYFFDSGDLVIDLQTGYVSHSNGTDLLTSIEIVAGGTGNDTITAAAATLEILGDDGNDRIAVSFPSDSLATDGGAGTDALVVSGAVTLDAISNMEEIELVGGTSLTLSAAQYNTGFYNAIAQVGMATVSGTGVLVFNMDSDPVTSQLYLTSLSFAGGSSVTVTIAGSSGIDVVKGAIAVANTITGGDGADQIRGGIQADAISGGIGNDKLFGWGGVDTLTGGTGSDQFRYFFATDSGTGAGAGADRITDFEIGIDKLNFTLIDTNPGLAGVQGFAFLGTADFTAPGTGQIRYLTSGSDLVVQADVNGDGAADMEVILQNLAGQVLTASDFMLGMPPALEPLSGKGIGGGVDVLPGLAAAKGGGEVQAFESNTIAQFQPEAYLHDPRFSVWGFVNEPWMI